MSTHRLLLRLALGLTLSLVSATSSLAATATTDPVGYNTISLLANSDTYVSVPFQRSAAFIGQVASFSGSTITVAGTPAWSGNQFAYAAGAQPETYYVFVRSGAKEGNYYTVTANTANTLTLDLAGDTLSGLVTNDSISVIPYWTLGTLFPTADLNVSYTSSSSPFVVQTYILIPNLEGSGTNLSTSSSYFFYNGAWRLFGQDLSVSHNNDTLLPDSYFIVRNSTTPTSLTTTGNVVTKKVVTPLQTYSGDRQDNPVALIRPVPVSLNDSGLISSGAFSASTSTLNIADQLLVFENSLTGLNKSAVATYFYYNGGWRKVGADVTQDFGSTIVFGPGLGVKIRKAQTSNGAAAVWTNTPTY